MSTFNKRKPRRKICQFCAKGIEQIDYKDTAVLEKYINQVAKILPRRVSGACAKHQRRIANSIKRARIVALLPFIRH